MTTDLSSSGPGSPQPSQKASRRWNLVMAVIDIVVAIYLGSFAISAWSVHSTHVRQDIFVPLIMMTGMLFIASIEFKEPPVQFEKFKSSLKGWLWTMLFLVVLVTSVRYLTPYTHSESWACVCFVGLMFIGAIIKRRFVKASHS